MKKRSALAYAIGIVLGILLAWLAGGAAGAAVKPGHAWHSCVPQATVRTGVYLVDNDLFDGSPGRSCVSTTDGHSFCVLTRYQSSGQGVVAFPDVRDGIFYGSRDRGSGFPYQVRSVPALVVHAHIGTCNGRMPGGNWLGEIHMWFYSNDQVRGHGRVELVTVMRSHDWLPYCTSSFRVGPRVSLIGRPVMYRAPGVRARLWLGYCGNEHRTGGAGHSWPLIVMQLTRQRSWLSLHVQPLFRQLRHLGWLGPDKWLGNIAVGGECEDDCKGFYGSMTVTGGLPRYQAP